MRAIVIGSFGGPEVLRLEERPDPEPAGGEVRVRVRATAVNRADLLQRMGHYPAPFDSPPDIPGLEFAGEVEATGPRVAAWRAGDRVFGLAGGGGYAEKVVVHERTLARIPDRLGFVEAAAVPEAFITAYDAMVDQGGLASGETVLISAAGSGVGTAAVQLACAIGARTVGTSRTRRKLERAASLGLEHSIVPENGRFADEVLKITEGRGVDVVLELVGGGNIGEDLACVVGRGRIMLVGLIGGSKTEVDLGLMLRKRIQLLGTHLRARPIEEKIAATQSFARHVVPLLAAGRVKPVVDRVMALAEAAKAHAYMASNEGFGKVVLDCG
jgi:NADPH2:quinone reductase